MKTSQLVGFCLFFIQTLLWQFEIVTMPSFIGFFLLGLTMAMFLDIKMEEL